MYGVTIGTKHSYMDLGLILQSKTIASPEPKINKVSIPGRDGDVDMTNVLGGDIKYNNRQISMTFAYTGDRHTWPDKYSELASYMHGQKLDIIFDDDLAYKYTGRVQIDEFASDGSIGKIVVTVDADPFKYDLISSAAEWEWDTFDFETGIINEGGNIEVNGTATVKIIGRRKRSYPIITASEAMTVTYDKETFNLKKGENKVYDIIFMEGENELTFRGTGTVSVDYTGGSL